MCRCRPRTAAEMQIDIMQETSASERLIATRAAHIASRVSSFTCDSLRICIPNCPLPLHPSLTLYPATYLRTDEILQLVHRHSLHAYLNVNKGIKNGHRRRSRVLAADMLPANGRGERGIFITILPSTELRRHHNSYIITLPPPGAERRRPASRSRGRGARASNRDARHLSATPPLIIHNFISLRA